MAEVSARELHRDLVDRLVDDATPVRRLWPVPVRLAVWWGLVVVATLFVRHLDVARPDLADRLGSAAWVAELGCLVVAASLLAHRALVGAVPGREAWRMTGWAVVALLAGGLGLGTLAGVHVDVRVADFATGGMRCFGETVLAALVPWAALLIATRRGAPMRAASVGVTAGAASWLMAYVIMRIRCPMEDALHVMVWHGGPAVLGTVASALLGAGMLASWRGRRRRIG